MCTKILQRIYTVIPFRLYILGQSYGECTPSQKSNMSDKDKQYIQKYIINIHYHVEMMAPPTSQNSQHRKLHLVQIWCLTWECKEFFHHSRSSTCGWVWWSSGRRPSLNCEKTCQGSRSFQPCCCWGAELSWCCWTLTSCHTRSEQKRCRWCIPENNGTHSTLAVKFDFFFSKSMPAIYSMAHKSVCLQRKYVKFDIMATFGGKKHHWVWHFLKQLQNSQKNHTFKENFLWKQLLTVHVGFLS